MPKRGHDRFDTANVPSELAQLAGSANLLGDYARLQGAARLALRWDPSCHIYYQALLNGFGGTRIEAALRHRIGRAGQAFVAQFPPGSVHGEEDLFAAALQESLPASLLAECLVTEGPEQGLYPEDVPGFLGAFFSFPDAGHASVYRDGLFGLWQLTSAVLQTFGDDSLYNLWKTLSVPFPVAVHSVSNGRLVSLNVADRWEVAEAQLRDAGRTLLLGKRLRLDPDGQTIMARAEFFSSSNDELNVRSHTQFDAAGRRIQRRLFLRRGGAAQELGCDRRLIVDVHRQASGDTLDPLHPQVFLFPGFAWFVRGLTNRSFASTTLAIVIARAREALQGGTGSKPILPAGRVDPAQIGRVTFDLIRSAPLKVQVDRGKRRVVIGPPGVPGNTVTFGSGEIAGIPLEWHFQSAKRGEMDIQAVRVTPDNAAALERFINLMRLSHTPGSGARPS